MYNINGGSYTMKYMIYNLKDKPEYIEEIALLTEKEWGKYKDKEELFEQIEQYFLIRARFETDRLR